MKRYVYMIAMMIMLLSITACGKESTTETGTSDKTTSEQTTTEDATTEDNSVQGNVEFQDEDGNVVMVASDIKSVGVETQDNPTTGVKEYVVTLAFTEEGTEKFKNVTAENIGNVISILVDGEVVSAPRVYDVIANGSCVINGISDYSTALDLAAKIKGDPNDAAKAEEAALNEQMQEDNKVKITLDDGTVLANIPMIDYTESEARNTGKGGSDEYYTVIHIKNDYIDAFAEVTGKHKGEGINLVVEGRLLFEGKITDQISDGLFIMGPASTSEEASELASVIDNALRN